MQHDLEGGQEWNYPYYPPYACPPIHASVSTLPPPPSTLYVSGAPASSHASPSQMVQGNPYHGYEPNYGAPYSQPRAIRFRSPPWGCGKCDRSSAHGGDHRGEGSGHRVVNHLRPHQRLQRTSMTTRRANMLLHLLHPLHHLHQWTRYET